MNKPLTIKDLLKACQEEIKKGHGDHVIMLSDDDEGNGYHYCWYAFTSLMDGDNFDDMAEELYRLDEEIAPADKTIILG